MSNITYDIMWREAMMELLDQLEAENPEDASLAPKTLSDWAVIYVRYLQIFRKLETTYDQTVHPQKRLDVKRALEACMGRLLELRHWMVKLNRGLDCVQLDDMLLDMKLTPDVLEVPVPRYFVEDRAAELAARDKLLAALQQQQLHAHQASDAGTKGSAASASTGPSSNALHRAIDSGAPLPPDEALAIIIRNERGRQGREQAYATALARHEQDLKRQQGATSSKIDQFEAVLRIQSGLRGMVTRMNVRRDAEHEQTFLGMRPRPVEPTHDPQHLAAQIMVDRKLKQADHLDEYDRAVVGIKAKVREMEGQDMRDAIQDKINAWYIAARNPETGEYPDFPEADKGGSKPILNPPLPTVEELLANDMAPGDGKDKGKGKKDGKAPAKKDAKKDGKGKGGKDSEPVEVVEEVVGSAFVPAIEAAISQFVARWQDRDESSNWEQKHEEDIVKEELRPLVFEEIRQQVDGEMRVLLQNLKDMLEAEKAARSKKGKKKKGKGKKAKKGKKDKKGKKGKKDPTADRSMESLFAELVNNGILKRTPVAAIQDYVGAPGLMGSAMEKAGLLPDASMAQVRQAITEYGILPLGSTAAHVRCPHIKSLLLYGPQGSGKSLLTQVIASSVGANYFDLSPRNTDGHYPSKNVAMLVHMVFKVARIMAPSVIVIDEAEKVFIKDKKKAKEIGGKEPYNRILKELLKEVKSLAPGDRVLIVGNSREPWLAAKKDEKALIGFWTKTLALPVPDYASRRLLFPALFERHGALLPYDFDLSTLAHISEGYTAGSLDAVVSSLLGGRRVERLKAHPVDIHEILAWLCKMQPVSKELDEAFRKWADKTPGRAAITTTSDGGSGSGGDKKGDKSKDKDKGKEKGKDKGKKKK